MNNEILNKKFEQCPNCKSYDTKRYFGIRKEEVRICLDCKCKYGY